MGSGATDDSADFNVNAIITFACVLAAVGTIFGGRALICGKNQAQDQIIRIACQELSSTTAFSAEYRTRWTGVCKPKNARTARIIEISAGSAMAPVQSIMVTVPPGVTAGGAACKGFRVPEPLRT